MKKILLGTTALVGAVALGSAAYAGGVEIGGGPVVSVGGHIDFQAGFADQDSAFEVGPNTREFKFQNDSEVHVVVEGQSDNGLVYGAVIELEADISGDADGQGVNSDKTYIYLETTAGRLELGGNSAAPDTMKVDASTFARATGGIDGDFYDYLTLTAAGFIVRPDLPVAHGTTATAGFGGITLVPSNEDATKITYYTPRFSGFQLGVSYTPDGGDAGTAAGFTGDLSGDFEHIFGLGLNYTGQYDQVGVQAAVTGEWGDSELAGSDDLAAWNVGLVLEYEGWSAGGSYGDWDDSGLATGSTADLDYWTLGAAYETGPYGISITYLESESGAAEFDNVVVGADYQLAPGLVPYIELSFFDADDGIAGTTDNDGTVLLLGTELSF